jgi:hypothetical protein
MSTCLFCAAEDDSTIEDVVPKWAVRKFAIPGKVTASASDRPGDGRRPVGRPMQALKVALTDALCARCNNAWLGGTIERPVARLLGPMAVDAKPTTLDALAQRLLSFWAVKTALLLELAIRQMHPGERTVEGYTPSDVELAYLRAHGRPPPRSMVWLGAYDCEKTKPLVYEPSGAELPTEDGERVAGHLATFTLGYVAFQVFSVDFLQAEQHVAVVWNTRVPRSLAGHLTRIWPEPLAVADLQWPAVPFAADEWRRLVTWDGKLRPDGINGL